MCLFFFDRFRNLYAATEAGAFVLQRNRPESCVLVLSADLSSLPTIILRRFLFTNDPAYLLLSVALGDVFLLPPPLLCGILFTLHKKTRKSVPDQSFALSHHTNSSWGATLVSFLMHLPRLLHCYDTGKSDLYQVKPTALF